MICQFAMQFRRKLYSIIEPVNGNNGDDFKCYFILLNLSMTIKIGIPKPKNAIGKNNRPKPCHQFKAIEIDSY